jgi:electron transport complex protein RnfC
MVNGCECEPYLTTDYRLMVEAPEAVAAGTLLAARADALMNTTLSRVSDATRTMSDPTLT